MGKLKGGKVSVLVVPEKEGSVFSFKLSLLAFRIALILAALAIIFASIMAFSWFGLLRKATIYDRLAEENATLLQEHNRILQLQNRVEHLQQLEGQIRRVLGADLASDTARRFAPPAYASQLHQPSAMEEREETLPAQRTAEPSVRDAIYSLRNPELLREPEIPSLWPVQGFVSRGFESDDVVPGRAHTGVDIAAKEGTVIKATAGGVVVWSGSSALYGNVVVLAHSSGYFSMYGHNQAILVKSRQRVERGDPIALLGNTGQSSAPHLHFEIWRENEALDPANLLMPF